MPVLQNLAATVGSNKGGQYGNALSTVVRWGDRKLLLSAAVRINVSSPVVLYLAVDTGEIATIKLLLSARVNMDQEGEIGTQLSTRQSSANSEISFRGTPGQVNQFWRGVPLSAATSGLRISYHR